MNIKVGMGFVLVVMVVCVGCREKERTERADLEARISELEARVQKAETNMNRLYMDGQNYYDLGHRSLMEVAANGKAQSIVAQQMFTNLMDLVMEYGDKIERIESTQKRMLAAQTNRVHQPMAYTATPPQPRMINGIPADVYDGIVARATAKWPTDFEVRQSVIKRQVDSYKALYGID